MSKAQKPKPVKLVRRQIPENAVIWVPGTPFPDQIQRAIDEKIDGHMSEYDQVHAERLKTYRPPAPIELGEIVKGMFYQLSGVYFEHGIEAVGLFLEELKAKAERRVTNEEGTLELATKAFDNAYNVRSKLDKILSGALKITVPEKRFGYEAQSPVANFLEKDRNKKPA